MPRTAISRDEANRRNLVSLVSYWPKGDCTATARKEGDNGHFFIRHTSHADAAYIAQCQYDDPSACVWIVPGTEQ